MERSILWEANILPADPKMSLHSRVLPRARNFSSFLNTQPVVRRGSSVVNYVSQCIETHDFPRHPPVCVYSVFIVKVTISFSATVTVKSSPLCIIIIIIINIIIIIIIDPMLSVVF